MEDILKDKVILLTSNEEWGDIWYSKQNYAYELSKNNKVFFIDPPKKWKPGNLFDRNVFVKKYSENLSIIEYKNVLPIINKLFFKLNDFLVSRKLLKFLEGNNISSVIYWAFDPLRLSHPQWLNAELSIFHSVDPYNFKHYGEKELAQRVDYIFCISSKLLKQYEAFNAIKYIVPHGISIEEFNLPDMEDKPEIEISGYGLYIGAIDERINFDLIEKLLINYPQRMMLFIGPVFKSERHNSEYENFMGKKYSNFMYLEPVSFKKLKYYIAKCGFGITPRRSSSVVTVSSHKLLQFLALGKPVFTMNIPDYDPSSNLVYMSNSEDELYNKISEFIKNGEQEELRNKRIELAKENSFPEIFRRIEKYLTSSVINKI